MSEEEIERKSVSLSERDLIVEYLSYALDEVEAISESGLHHLRMAISSIARDSTPDASCIDFLSTLEYDKKSAN
jgi:hypothetical protein